MKTFTRNGFFWKAIFGLLSVSSILLFIPSLPIPGLSIIEVRLMNNNNISIGNFEGVTRISYGTWMACYYNKEGDHCTPRTLPGQPYTFTVVNNNTGDEFSSNTLWSQGLAIQLWGFIFTLIVTAFLLLYYHFIKRRSKAQIEEPNRHASTATPQLFRLPLTHLITVSLFIPILIIITTECIISDVIQNEITSALSDEFTDVAVGVAGGFWLNVVVVVLFIFVVALKLFFDRGYVAYSTAVAGRA